MKKEKLLKLLFLLAACAAVFTIFLIILFVAVQVIPLFFKVSLFEFLSGSDWEPLAGHFGALPLIYGSFLVTLGNLLLGAPLSIAVAIFLSEIAPTSIIRLVRPAVELLILGGLIVSPITGGGPACLIEHARSERLVRVICFGAVTLSPVYSIVFGLFCLAFFAYFSGLDYSMVAGALILALMILSVLMGAVKKTIMAFPQDFRWACFELRVSKWPAIREVVLTSAMPRIIAGSISGMGRAFVETAAVFFQLVWLSTFLISLLFPAKQ